MWQDPIVAEVRQYREDYAARYNFDIQALCRALKEQEQQSQRLKVSFSPKCVVITQEAKPPSSKR